MYIAVSNGQLCVEVGGISGGVATQESEQWVKRVFAGLSSGEANVDFGSVRGQPSVLHRGCRAERFQDTETRDNCVGSHECRVCACGTGTKDAGSGGASQSANVDVGDGNGIGGRCNDSGTSVLGATEGKRASNSSRGCLPGETTRERNRRWSRARKEKKKKRQTVVDAAVEVDSVPEWRRKADASMEVAVAKSKGELGYFSNMPASVKRDLSFSRAQMMIAENDLRARRARESLKRMEDEAARRTEVTEFIRSIKKSVGDALAVKKMTENTEVQGWVETVVNSVVREAASNAPSSIQSLKSYQSQHSAASSMSVDGTKRVYATPDSSTRPVKVATPKVSLHVSDPTIGDSGMYVCRRAYETAKEHKERADAEKKARGIKV